MPLHVHHATRPWAGVYYNPSFRRILPCHAKATCHSKSTPAHLMSRCPHPHLYLPCPSRDRRRHKKRKHKQRRHPAPLPSLVAWATLQCRTPRLAVSVLPVHGNPPRLLTRLHVKFCITCQFSLGIVMVKFSRLLPGIGQSGSYIVHVSYLL